MITSSTIWNTELLGTLSRLGHGDLIVITDAGLPRPERVRVLDLAIRRNEPRIATVVDVVMADGAFEGAYLAEELRGLPHERELSDRLTNTPTTWVTHETLKDLSSRARLIVRTGEARPYMNVVLQAAVLF